MTKSKKKATEMTDEELEKRAFPKKVLDELKRIAQQEERPQSKQSLQKKSIT
ncbi:MAG: hypothetical protein HY666_02830 [Chloroflexi bacterium]|nr:hypothetical protein [Chloroflexota bacterium]